MKWFCGTLVVLSFVFCLELPAQSSRPNILLIVSDDHGYADQSRLGIHRNVKTPAIDKLARQSVRFSQAYVTGPICNTSRLGLLTGQNQARFGAYWYGQGKIPAATPTIASGLKSVGYNTGYIGKLHYGRDNPDLYSWPTQHGFDECFVATGGRIHYLQHGENLKDQFGAAAARMAMQPVWNNETPVKQWQGYMTEEIGTRARSFIENHYQDEHPFFLQVAFTAVHNFTWQLPDRYLRKHNLPKFPDWDPEKQTYYEWYDGVIMPNLPHGREYYLTQLHYLDLEIKRLMTTLERLKLDKNTVVIYTTDNGGSTCNFGDNTPLRGTKYTLFEGGVRVPLFVRWPEKLPHNVVRDQVVSSMDLMPTLHNIAGVEAEHWRHCDGADIWSILLDGKGSGHATLHWDCGHQWSIRDGDWKLKVIANAEATERQNKHEHCDSGKGTELYNLAMDPAETKNLAEQYPDIAMRLNQLHQRWKTQIKP
ncbi:MAG: sulfatase-like hydrolase/transferase [Planctomycetota bacterium]|nr:sulfatase-like hydrolase/transferase [Planctomycetota bacterium]